MRLDYLIGFGGLGIFVVIGAYNAYTAWKQGEPNMTGGTPRAPREGSPVKYIVRQFGIYAFGIAVLGLGSFLAATRS